MAGGVNYTVRINSNVQSKLAEIQTRLNDLTPAMKNIGAEVKSLIELGFTNSETPFGEKWLAVARGGKPLIDTSRLRNSFTYLANNKSVEVGTNVSYAEKHQSGKGVRKRQFLPDKNLPPDWSSEIINSMDDYIKRVIK